MRVLIVCDFFLKYGVQQAVGLTAIGADVALLCRTHAQEFGHDPAERRAVLAQARSSGAEVFELPGRISSLAVVPDLCRTRGAIRTWAPDIVHAHTNQDPRLLAIAWPYPLVVTVHDPSPHPGDAQPSWTRALTRRLWIRRAQRIVIHSDALRSSLRRLGANGDVHVIPHGIEVRHEPLAVPASPTVLLFGRLNYYKGVDVLLEAFARVRRERPEILLLIRGEGPCVPQDDPDNGIEVRPGYLPETDLEQVLQRTSLVVLPYLEASQSGVGALALARGIPVIVTDVGALPDIALDNTYVVPRSDPKALAAAILTHISDGAELRNRVITFAEQFSWSRVASRSLALYDTVLGTAE